MRLVIKCPVGTKATMSVPDADPESAISPIENTIAIEHDQLEILEADHSFISEIKRQAAKEIWEDVNKLTEDYSQDDARIPIGKVQVLNLISKKF